MIWKMIFKKIDTGVIERKNQVQVNRKYEKKLENRKEGRKEGNMSINKTDIAESN